LKERAGYAQPANLARRVVDTVCILLGVKLLPYHPETYTCRQAKGDQKSMEPSWQFSGQNLIHDPEFVNRLDQFDPESITDEMCDLMKPYLAMADFEPQFVQIGSPVAAFICKWVQMMAEYHESTSVMRAQRRAADNARESLDESESEADELSAEVAEKTDYVTNMHGKLLDAREEQSKAKEERDVKLKEVRGIQGEVDVLLESCATTSQKEAKIKAAADAEAAKAAEAAAKAAEAAENAY
jgi:hypothetical protein